MFTYTYNENFIFSCKNVYFNKTEIIHISSEGYNATEQEYKNLHKTKFKVFQIIVLFVSVVTWCFDG